MPTDNRIGEETKSRASARGTGPPVSYDASQHLCFNLGKVVRRVYNLYHQPLAEYGLTPSQLFVFSALWAENGVNFSDLADKVSIDVSTLTGIIDRMEKMGFVSRRPDPRDRRAIRLHLTEKSKQNGAAILKLAEDLDTVLRRPFNRADIETFERVLRALGEQKD